MKGEIFEFTFNDVEVGCVFGCGSGGGGGACNGSPILNSEMHKVRVVQGSQSGNRRVSFLVEKA